MKKKISSRVLIFLVAINLLVNLTGTVTWAAVSTQNNVKIQVNSTNTTNKLCVVENISSTQGEICFIGYILGLNKELNFMNCSVYVDGVAQDNTLFDLTTKISRPEIKKKYPQYIGAENSGFSYRFDSTKVKNGQHKIKFNFAGLGKEVLFNVTNQPKIIQIDPVPLDEDEIIFTGYTLGICKNLNLMNCSVYVDGVNQNDTILNLATYVSRPELKRKYPQYKNAENSGFSYKLNTTKLKNGQHKIKFNFAGLEKEILFKVENSKKVFEVATDANKGIINFNGYLLSNLKTMKLENCKIYLDNKCVTNTSKSLFINLNRPQLKSKYPQFKNAESGGFRYTLDSKTIPNGSHSITFNFSGIKKEFTFSVNNSFIGNEGKTKILEVTPNVQVGEINFKGYLLGNVEDLDIIDCHVYIDDIERYDVYENLQVNTSNPELKAKYPNYINAENCGFNYRLDSTTLSNGQHKIKFSLANIEKEFAFYINNKPTIFEMDKVVAQEGIINFTGYVLGYDKAFNFINSKVYIDDVLQESPLLNINTRINRPELKIKYPDYANAENCGFSYQVDTQNIKNGKHKIKFSFHGIEKELLFNVNNKRPILEIESIKKKKTGLLQINGYKFSSFDESPKDYDFKVFIDGKLYNSCIFSIENHLDSSDLVAKYPEYKGHNKNRFSYLVNTTKLGNGQHTIKFTWPEVEKTININVNNLPDTKISNDEDIMCLEDLNNGFNTIVDVLNQVNESTKEINVAINQMNSGLKESNTGINQANSGLEKVITTLDPINAGIKEANAGMDQANAAFKEINSATNQVNVGLEKVIALLDPMNAAIKEANAGMDQANAAIIEMNAALDYMNSALVIVNSAINQMNSVIITMNATMDQMNTTLDQMNATLDQMNIILDDINSLITQSTAIINISNTNMDKVIKGITQAVNGIDSLLELASNSKISNDQRRQAEIDKLNNQMEALKQKQEEYNSKWYNKVWQYIKSSGSQVALGKYSNNVTFLGTIGELGVGLVDLDAPADIRDLCHDLEYWEFSWSHAGETTLDAIGLLPIIGVLKYGDEVGVLVKDGEKLEIEKIVDFEKKATDAIDPSKLGGVWKLSATERGEVIEEILASTEYKDWYNIGSSQNGYFPTIDFQKGNEVVSLKTIDPTLPSFTGDKATEKILAYLDELHKSIRVNGELVDKTLDIRIPSNTQSNLNLDYLLKEAKIRGIKLVIKEFK